VILETVNLISSLKSLYRLQMKCHFLKGNNNNSTKISARERGSYFQIYFIYVYSHFFPFTCSEVNNSTSQIHSNNNEGSITTTHKGNAITY
jgi:hypothetical protein